MAGGTTLALSGGGKKTATQAPPINAASSDEADFIKCADSNPEWLSPAADPHLGSSWRKPRRKRRRRSTRRCRGHGCRREASIPGVNSTTIDRGEYRAIEHLEAAAASGDDARTWLICVSMYKHSSLAKACLLNTAHRTFRNSDHCIRSSSRNLHGVVRVTMCRRRPGDLPMGPQFSMKGLRAGEAWTDHCKHKIARLGYMASIRG